MTRIKVYVAGPYSLGDKAENTCKAISMGDALVCLGFTPFVPHLSHTWNELYPHQEVVWYQYGLGWLTVCDALIRIPGVSKGADAEEEEARRLGIPVFYDLKSLVDWRVCSECSVS